MADKTIGELTRATQVQASDLFVLEQSGTAKAMTGQTFTNWLTAYADGHGGVQEFELVSTSGRNKTYQFTMADETTFQFTVVDGEKGDTGDQTYVHFKWAAQEPTADNQLSNNPDEWIGIYSGTSSTAPTAYTAYTWYQYKGEMGEAAELDSSEITYQASASGVSVPGGDWDDDVPVVPQGYYLWTRTVLTWNNEETTTFYSVSRQGVDGQGAPSDDDPLMDGTADPGEMQTFSRSDHVHPSDTSRAAADEHNLETYTSVTQLGFNVGSATIAGVWAALPDGATLIAQASDFASAQVPNTVGTVQVTRSNTYRGGIFFMARDAGGLMYYQAIASSGAPAGTWYLYPLAFEDIPLSADNTFTWKDGGEITAYRYGQLGVLDIQLGLLNLPSDGDYHIAYNLPSGIVPVSRTLQIATTSGGSVVAVSLETNRAIRLYAYRSAASGWVRGTLIFKIT